MRGRGSMGGVPAAEETLRGAITGGVGIFRTSANGDYLTIYADRAVIFTHEKQRGAFGALDAQTDLAREISGAYLEGDVRITFTSHLTARPDQRLFANRIYYDFDTDRAVLSDVVLRSTDPPGEPAIAIRAAELGQVSTGEFRGDHVEMSTSSFATPTFSVKTDEVYIRQEDEVSSYTGLP